MPDPMYDKSKEQCRADFRAPVVPLLPHTAALGMVFYKGSMFPADDWSEAIFIAEHGCWNCDELRGFRVSSVRLRDGKYVYEGFAEGWLGDTAGGERACGRPVDVLIGEDGALFISSDGGGLGGSGGGVFRVAYSP